MTGIFEQTLIDLVRERGYSWRELVNLMRAEDRVLSDEGRWIKMVCVQAGLEHMARSEQVL